MEERGIIKATFAKLLKSNAFIYWLTEVKGEASIPASTPVNALGEGPVDVAYREFLLWQCGQLAAEVSVLFDPATLASRLCPRPAVLKELVEAMNAANLVEAWKAGNEETIGWVYQGFSAEELEAAFTAARTEKKKFEPEDIPAVTQLFTIRWVVRFLVENTLGRIWVEMHPDSRMAQSLGYLVPPKHPQQRALRPVKDITFLDPCCGSMHFGLLAFDLFAEMYREERENAGKPGWPDKPSAATEEEIPELILAHNLHGIDIDTRAVQLSALTLVLKARMLNPKARVTDTNLATANIEQLTGGRLDEFISKTQFSHPIYERILRRLADRVKDSPHLGSLLRLEKDIKQLVDAERQRSGELLKELPGMHPEQFDTEQGVEEFFDILTDQILRHLDHFVQATRAEGQDAGLFAREAAKGLRFLNLIDQRYDVVATNPPYLSGRKMNKRLATLMERANTRRAKATSMPPSSCAARNCSLPRALWGCSPCTPSCSSAATMTCAPGCERKSPSKPSPTMAAASSPSAIPAPCKPPPSSCGGSRRRRGGKAGGHLLPPRQGTRRRRQTPRLRIRPRRPPPRRRPPPAFPLPTVRLRRHPREAMGLLDYSKASECISQIILAWKHCEASPWWPPVTISVSAILVGSLASEQISFKCASETQRSVKCVKWFPYVKGGGFCRWYGNQFIVNWTRMVRDEMSSEMRGHPPGHRLTTRNSTSRQAVTYSHLSSGANMLRYSESSSLRCSRFVLFPVNAMEMLGRIQLPARDYRSQLINPTY